MNSNDPRKHVVIVGGGFAGLTCAHTLSTSKDVRVTLIDKNNFHQFQPLLYQLATAELGTGDVATSLRQALHGCSNVDVKLGEVTAADPTSRTVTTKGGLSCQGDFLVLAAGSQVNFFGTPGADHCSPDPPTSIIRSSYPLRLLQGSTVKFGSNHGSTFHGFSQGLRTPRRRRIG